MIIFITGVPGSGKSAACVKLIGELGQDRPLFVSGIPDLKLPHLELKNPHDWMGECPDGSVIVVDEAQRAWPARGPGSKMPASVEAMQTHRHRGITIVVVTQHPRLVDPGVRELGQRHIFLRDLGILGRWWYEWPGEVVDNPRAAWRQAPIKRRYKLPREVFALYTSASEHVKVRGSVPPRLVLVLVLVPVLLGIVWWVTARVGARVSGSGSVGEVKPVSHAASGVQVKVPDAGPFADVSVRLVGSYRVEGRPSESIFALWREGGGVMQYVRTGDLVRAGYSVVALAPCVVRLELDGARRMVYCEPARDAPAVAGAASGAADVPGHALGRSPVSSF